MTAPDSPAVTAVRQMADRFRDGAVLRAEADRPHRGAWDDQVLAKATALADQILGGTL